MARKFGVATGDVRMLAMSIFADHMRAWQSKALKQRGYHSWDWVKKVWAEATAQERRDYRGEARRVLRTLKAAQCMSQAGEK